MRPCQCPICQEPFESLEDIAALICGHVFHRECVERWLVEARRTCPTCRCQLSAVRVVGGIVPSLYFAEIDEANAEELTEQGSTQVVRELLREKARECAKQQETIDSLNVIVQELNDKTENLNDKLSRQASQLEHAKSDRHMLKRQLESLRPFEAECEKSREKIRKLTSELKAVHVLRQVLSSTKEEAMDCNDIEPGQLFDVLSALQKEHAAVCLDREKKAAKIDTLEKMLKRVKLQLGTAKDERDTLKEELKMKTLDSKSPFFNAKAKRMLNDSTTQSLENIGNYSNLFSSPESGSPFKMSRPSPGFIDTPDILGLDKHTRRRPAETHDTDFNPVEIPAKRWSPSKNFESPGDPFLAACGSASGRRPKATVFRRPALADKKPTSSSQGSFYSDGLGGSSKPMFQTGLSRQLSQRDVVLLGPGSSKPSSAVKRSSSVNVSGRPTYRNGGSKGLQAFLDARPGVVAKKPKLTSRADGSFVDLVSP